MIDYIVQWNGKIEELTKTTALNFCAIYFVCKVLCGVDKRLRSAQDDHDKQYKLLKQFVDMPNFTVIHLSEKKKNQKISVIFSFIQLLLKYKYF